VAHVINYDLPDLAEDFIHRVGRTGHAGLQDRASTLVASGEIIELRRIKRTLKMQMVFKRIKADASAATKAYLGELAAQQNIAGIAGKGVCVIKQRRCMTTSLLPIYGAFLCTLRKSAT
jgi:superfamily II DNA/RNA helicase